MTAHILAIVGYAFIAIGLLWFARALYLGAEQHATDEAAYRRRRHHMTPAHINKWILEKRR